MLKRSVCLRGRAGRLQEEVWGGKPGVLGEPWPGSRGGCEAAPLNRTVAGSGEYRLCNLACVSGGL